MKKILFHYWPETLITLVVWILIGWKMGLSAFFITLVLSMLEITLSADNAVVNSRVLVKMSLFWQRMFLTVGIFIAVFLIRFALPIVLVAAASEINVAEVLHLALNNPDEYGNKLLEIAPVIDGFGGLFLLMVAVFFFVDNSKKVHWLNWPEQAFAWLGKIRLATYGLVVLTAATVLILLSASERVIVAISMATAVGVYCLLHIVTFFMEKIEDKNRFKKQVGWAAFISFIYLEVLDASFSLDGVVGAFALTNNIVIIMAGLGIGAIWVRTMTIYMVRHETLSKYQYLESGAHWAIFALACVMLLKLFDVELPELVVGSIGLVFIAGSVFSSARLARRDTKVL